jgi:hypothetical protein
LRQVLFQGLGGDLVGQVAQLELVGPEEVLVVGADQQAGECIDLCLGGLADGLRQGLGLGDFLGRQRRRRHDRLLGTKLPFLTSGQRPPLCTKIPPTFKTLTETPRTR